MKVIKAAPLPSLARVSERDDGRQVTVGLVQMHWVTDPEEHAATIADGIGAAAAAGASIVFLPELTLSRYPAYERATGAPLPSSTDRRHRPRAGARRRPCPCAAARSCSPPCCPSVPAPHRGNHPGSRLDRKLELAASTLLSNPARAERSSRHRDCEAEQFAHPRHAAAV